MHDGCNIGSRDIRSIRCTCTGKRQMRMESTRTHASASRTCTCIGKHHRCAVQRTGASGVPMLGEQAAAICRQVCQHSAQPFWELLHYPLLNRWTVLMFAKSPVFLLNFYCLLSSPSSTAHFPRPFHGCPCKQLGAQATACDNLLFNTLASISSSNCCHVSGFHLSCCLTLIVPYQDLGSLIKGLWAILGPWRSYRMHRDV
jgi:hypothetical protein